MSPGILFYLFSLIFVLFLTCGCTISIFIVDFVWFKCNNMVCTVIVFAWFRKYKQTNEQIKKERKKMSIGFLLFVSSVWFQGFKSNKMTVQPFKVRSQTGPRRRVHQVRQSHRTQFCLHLIDVLSEANNALSANISFFFPRQMSLAPPGR